jgi:hypothetical protein|tara:strand:+ start:212 stop:448 length:237 start_codon:yes stop_codon:yes gene_type:complete
MKRILITVGVIMTMSFTNKLWNYDLVTALDNLEDCREWMQQDIENGRIESKIGELYIENFNEIIHHLRNVDRVNNKNN